MDLPGFDDHHHRRWRQRRWFGNDRFNSVPAETAVDDTVLDNVAERLFGLSIADFLDEPYLVIISRYPEYVVELGLGEDLELVGDELNNFSRKYQQQTLEMVKLIQSLLADYNQGSLVSDELFSHNIYRHCLDDWISEEPYAEFEYPGTYHITGGRLVSSASWSQADVRNIIDNRFAGFE